MESKIEQYINGQPSEWRMLLTRLHEVIIGEDKKVTAGVEPMMGKQMIMYKCKGMMKYALSGTKNYMTLHVLPMYGSATLFTKYRGLLDKANFQKGCINFNNEDEMPPDIVRQLIADCAPIDLEKIRKEYLDSKKRTGKPTSDAQS